jgi:hypothetical protein
VRLLPCVALTAAVLATPAWETRPPDEILTVPFVDSRVDALNGQRISVGGYLGECLGHECRLYATKEQFDRDKSWFAAAMAANGRIDVPAPAIPAVGIGTGPDDDFDGKAAPFVPSYVIITGAVTNRCRFNGVPDCTDRSTDIEPEAIRAGGAPPAS